MQTPGRSSGRRSFALTVALPLFAVLIFPDAPQGWSAEDGSPEKVPPAAEPAKDTVFDAPQIQAMQTSLLLRFLQLAQAKRLADAEALLTRAVQERRLDNAANRYNLACAQAVQGKTEAALASLAAAVERGWADAEHLRKDADLESLRALPRFEELARAAAEKAKQAKPTPPAQAEVKDGVALVSEANTNWVPQIQQFLVLHQFPPADPNQPITTLDGPVGDLLRQWQKEGTAAGLHGFLYDNHDRDHSNMDYGRFPGLTRVEYAEPPKKHEFDHGLQQLFLHNAPTIGNSSTALVAGPFWSSQSRIALRTARTANVLAQQYLNNHLYFYPEHRDHDADGFGDVYHANTPYTITSQGSSGSDRAFLQAVACTLAAFRPDTQRMLIEKKLLMPTVQMVFRLSRKPVAGPDDYLTGKAHPAVFGEETLDAEKMVRTAHDLKPDEIPPLVQLRVVEEDAARAGVDYFEAGDAEKVFDTVSAIARVAPRPAGSGGCWSVPRTPAIRTTGRWSTTGVCCAAIRNACRSSRWTRRARGPSCWWPGTSGGRSRRAVRCCPAGWTSACSRTTERTTRRRPSSVGTSPPTRSALTTTRIASRPSNTARRRNRSPTPIRPCSPPPPGAMHTSTTRRASCSVGRGPATVRPRSSRAMEPWS